MPRYTTQRRWGQRVRKQARKEVMKLAETKRVFTYGIPMNTQTPVAVGSQLVESFIYNPLALLGIDTLPVSVEGTEYIDPLLVGRFSVSVDWVRFASSFNSLPTVVVHIYLIATPVEYTVSGSSGRQMSATEAQEFWLRQPNNLMQPIMNTDNMTVITKRKVKFTPKGMVANFGSTGLVSRETKNIKIAKRLKGTKQQQQDYNASGVAQAKSGYLKGYQFYWVCATMSNGQAVTAGTLFSPLSVIMDSYLYFKDL